MKYYVYMIFLIIWINLSYNFTVFNILTFNLYTNTKVIKYHNIKMSFNH